MADLTELFAAHEPTPELNLEEVHARILNLYNTTSLAEVWKEAQLKRLRNLYKISELSKEYESSLIDWVNTKEYSPPPDLPPELELELFNLGLSFSPGVLVGPSALTKNSYKFFTDKLATQAEISNLPARFLKKSVKPGKTYKLGDILDFPDLYEAYPDLKDVKIKYNRAHSGAMHLPGENLIIIGGDSLKKSNLLHEVQHAIQHREPTFPKGTSLGKQYQLVQEGNYKEEFEKVLANHSYTWESVPEHKLNDLAKETAYNIYFKTAGEVQARAGASKLGYEKYMENIAPKDIIFINHIKNKIQQEIKAYHGSGAIFDKFSDKFMKTGEGAHAFGWGLYFSSVKDIAKHYAKKLGKLKISDLTNAQAEDVARVLQKKGYFSGGLPENPNELKLKLINLQKIPGNDVKEAMRVVSPYEVIYKGKPISKVKLFEQLEEKSGAASDANAIILAKSQYSGKRLRNYLEEFIIPKEGETWRKYDVNELIRDIEVKKTKNVGKVYDVTLHKGKTPEQYDYLDWYEPVTKKQVEKIVKNFSEKDRYAIETLSRDSGKLVYEKLGYILKPGASHGQQQEAASLFLKDAGIEGIRYPTRSLSGGAKKQSIFPRIKGLSPYEKEELFNTAKKINSSFERFSDLDDFIKIFQTTKIGTVRDKMNYKEIVDKAAEELGWIKPKYNYVVFDPEAVTINE